MKLTFDEKKILYTWGCPVYKNTVIRLAFAAAYMTDNDAKHSSSHSKKVVRFGYPSALTVLAAFFPCTK